jgi:hypothetical protein
VLRSNESSQPVLTGIGFVDFRNRLFAPISEDQSYLETFQGLEIYSLVRVTSRSLVIFPFHDACWTLLLSRVDYSNRPVQTTKHLFDILQSTPSRYGRMLEPGHDYGGMIPDRVHGDHRLRQMRRSQYCYVISNPMITLPMLKPQSISPLIQPNDLFNPNMITRSSSTDPFWALPDELIMIIIIHLPSKDIRPFRLSSRRVANISGPSQLPQSFWSSRFSGNMEMEFVLAGGELPSGHIDWRSKYFSIKASLRDTKTVSGLRNKYRIWEALGYISYALQNMILFKFNSEAENVLTENSISHFRRGNMICGRVLSQDLIPLKFEAFSSGCRQISSKPLIWPDIKGLAACTFYIGVSTLYLNGRHYISGVRFLHSTSNRLETHYDDTVAISSAGLIIPPSEERVCLDTQSKLNGIDVVANISGVIGLRFLVSCANDTYSHTFGNLDTEQFGTGIARLSPSYGDHIPAILVGTDVEAQLHN